MFGAATLSMKNAGVLASLFLLIFLLAGGYYVQVTQFHDQIEKSMPRVNIQ